MECVGEKSRYYDLFPDTKAVIGMIHSRGDATESAVERAEKEIEIYQRCGVDAVLVEDFSARRRMWKRFWKCCPDIIPE